MGQITIPTRQDLILTDIDRLIARNADGGVSGNNLILLGEDAGKNSAVNDLIILGHLALDAGLVSATAAGTIVLGSSSASAMTTADAAIDQPSTIIGHNTLQSAVNISGVVAIGAKALNGIIGNTTAAGAVASSVIIGNEAMERILGNVGDQVFPTNLVVIGFRAARGTAAIVSSLQSSVIIGANACGNTGNAVDGAGISDSVIIGFNAAQNLGNTANVAQLNVIIGSTCVSTSLVSGDSNVFIGATLAVSENTALNNVAIGAGITGAGGDNNVLLGQSVVGPTTGDRNIVLGALSGTGETSPYTDKVFLETVIGGVRRGVLYGDMNLGNLILGKSTPGVDRELTGTNTVKIVNGTRGAGNPAAGGFFYVTAGTLHFVQSNGTDIKLNIGAGGILASSNVALTDGAGVAAGTITNAPTAGNPTKWVPIDDNGVTRHIPAW